MSKTAIIYWSGTGNTEEMAKAIQAGTRQAGAEAQLFEVEQALGPPDVVCPMERVPGLGMKQQEVRLNAPGIMQNTGLHQLQSP